jgi:hypothetical protein
MTINHHRCNVLYAHIYAAEESQFMHHEILKNIHLAGDMPVYDYTN